MDDLDRLFHRMVQALADSPERLHEPVQVAELYQELVPYRKYRAELRLETHQDYELAVLRLLAGERGYARVEPTEVRDALAAEIQAAYPDTGVVREFAAARVYLDPGAVRHVLAGGSAYAPSPPAALVVAPDTPVDSATAEPAAAEEEQPDGARERRPAREQRVEAIEPCPYCGADLPMGRDVFYCPFCGGNLRGVRCPECRTELEVGWTYCITCGRKMARA